MRMIDKIIRAMQDTGLIDGMSAEDADTLATAALEGMMIPSEYMMQLGSRQQLSDRGGPDSIWHTMIDAALNE